MAAYIPIFQNVINGCGLAFVVLTVATLLAFAGVYLLKVSPITKESYEAASCRVNPQQLANTMWQQTQEHQNSTNKKEGEK